MSNNVSANWSFTWPFRKAICRTYSAINALLQRIIRGCFHLSAIIAIKDSIDFVNNSSRSKLCFRRYSLARIMLVQMLFLIIVVSTIYWKLSPSDSLSEKCHTKYLCLKMLDSSTEQQSFTVLIPFGQVRNRFMTSSYTCQQLQIVKNRQNLKLEGVFLKSVRCSVLYHPKKPCRCQDTD